MEIKNGGSDSRTTVVNNNILKKVTDLSTIFSITVGAAFQRMLLKSFAPAAQPHSTPNSEQ